MNLQILLARAFKILTPLLILFLFTLIANNHCHAQQNNQTKQVFVSSKQYPNTKAGYLALKKEEEARYRSTITWDRYYWAAPGLKPMHIAKTRQYYQTAFIEAEKYFAVHKHDPCLTSNKYTRSDLLGLCNSMLTPYMNNRMPGAASNSYDNQVLIRQRIWLLYNNAFGSDNEDTKRARHEYEKYKAARYPSQKPS